MMLTWNRLSNRMPMKMKQDWQLPKPGGSYEVGAIQMTFTDSSRQDALCPGGLRMIPVIAWYPARDVSGCAIKPYISKILDETLTAIRTNAFLDAQVSTEQKTYPVILFSHGFTMYNESNTMQMEELASRGYIVFSVGHIGEGTYELPGGVGSDTDDARCRELSSEMVPLMKYYLDYIAAIQQDKERVHLDELGEYLDRCKISMAKNNIWAEDTEFVIERIAAGDVAILAGHADLEQLGIFGMSFGGSVALHLAITDKRVKACIDLDGMLYSEYYKEPLRIPTMILQNGDAKTKNYMRTFYQISLSDAFLMTIKTSNHANFTDLSVLAENNETITQEVNGEKFEQVMFGAIDGERMEELLNGYVVAFFDRYLKGQASPLLTQPVDDEEISYEFKLEAF